VKAYSRHVADALASGRPLVFYDLETTGLDKDIWLPDGTRSKMPRVWQMAAIRRNPDGTELAAERILNCGEKLSADIIRVCGLRAEDADLPEREGKPASEVLPRWAEFVRGAYLVGHNIVGFDNPLLAYEFARAGLPAPIQLLDKRLCIDTMILARELFAGAVKFPVNEKGTQSARLVDVGTFFACEFDASKLHGAMADTRLTCQVLDCLSNEIKHIEMEDALDTWLTQQAPATVISATASVELAVAIEADEEF